MEDYYSEQQIQQVPIQPNELYAQEMNENKMKNIIAQISPVNQVEEIEMRLKGYKKNIFSSEWEKITKNFNTTIPEDLISRYTSWLSSFMNINTIMGNLSEHQITRIMSNCVEWVIDDVESHAEAYGIETDYTERTRICDILLNSTFFVLNRSLNGIESRRFWSSLTLSESVNMNPNQQNKSSDWWKFWKK